MGLILVHGDPRGVPESVRRARRRDARQLDKAQRYAVPPVRMDAWAWRREVAAALETETEGMAYGRRRRALRRRADRMRRCGSRVRVAQCECGDLQPGTGEIWLSHPCEARTCPTCDRRRAHRRAAQLYARCRQIQRDHDAELAVMREQLGALQPGDPGRITLAREIRRRERCSFRLITVTAPWDPSRAESFTVDALGERITLLRQAIGAFAGARGAMHSLGGGQALFTNVECADGFVHAHAIHFGPYVPKPMLADAVRRAGGGYVDIRRADLSDDRRLRGACAEAVKYAVKAPSPLSEQWLAGSPRWVPHPVLAARWEIATYGRRLTEAYGRFRGLVLAEDDLEPGAVEPEEVQPVATPAPCASCGRGPDRWRWVIVDLRWWVGACHARGRAALRASRWRGRGPPAVRGPIRPLVEPQPAPSPAPPPPSPPPIAGEPQTLAQRIGATYARLYGRPAA